MTVPEGLIAALEADARAWLGMAGARRRANLFLEDAARFEISAANARAAIEEIRYLYDLLEAVRRARSGPEPTIEEAAEIIHRWEQAPPVPGPVDPREYFPKK